MLPAILQNPGLRPLTNWMIAGICCAGIGLAAANFHNRLRRKCSLQYDLQQGSRELPYTGFIMRRVATIPGEPRVCTQSIIWMWASFVLFVGTVITVGVGGWSVVRRDIPATFPCWDLKDVGGHALKFNSCSGVIATADLTPSAVGARPAVVSTEPPSPASGLQPSTAAAERVVATPEANHAAQSDVRGTRASPVSVDVIALPGATEEDKRERARESHEKASSDRLLVRFTGVLAAATLGLSIATLLLWYATRRLVRDAKENAERQLRAYVGVESSSINYASGSHPVAGVTFKNYGNTPAYEFTINSGIGMAPCFEGLPPPPPEDPGEPRGVLSPGATAVLLKTGPVLLGSEHLAALKGGSSTIFVYGEVRYMDAFKKRRFLKYRLMTGGSAGLRGNALSSCEKGNDAD
jgi:hypothetical protein